MKLVSHIERRNHSVTVARALAIAAWLFLPAAVHAQGRIAGMVAASESGLPLANALITAPDLGAHAFTDSAGRFTLLVPSGHASTLGIQVRRLGYAPFDTVVGRADRGPLRVLLDRAAMRLDAVTVREMSECVEPGRARADTTLVTVLSQLLMNARQLKILSDDYPFSSTMNVQRAVKDVGKDVVRLDLQRTIAVSSRSRWRYRPGGIVTTGRGSYIFNVPTVADLADERFLASHCLHYAGVDTVDGQPMLRVNVAVSRQIRTPDVNGALYLDPETFQIRRSVLRLSRLPPIRGITSYEVTTDFAEIMPSVPVIQHIFGRQTFDTTRVRAHDYVFEEWTLLEVKFGKRKPGGEQ